MTIDLYPTLLEVAGTRGNAEHNAAVDGVSLLPLLRDADATLKREALYWHYPHYHAGGDSPDPGLDRAATVHVLRPTHADKLAATASRAAR